ncbi:MAG: hypothetical protein H6833_14095 [Planctomycetes bacterium]|nr:hypothetical protein [Planctomycetota bacterium]
MPHSPQEKLREVFPRIAESLADGALPIVLFDLDSTLFETGSRNLRILREFADAQRGAHAELPELVAALTVDDMGWNVHECLSRRGVEDAALLQALRGFWFERFFTDEYVKTDLPAPGSVEFVNHCHQAGAMIYYLSGRHVGGMETGTVQALTDHGFPFWRGRCAIHLKPSFDMADRAFKDEAVADIRSYKGRVVASFENEPGNANLFLEAFPGALHFLLDTVTSPEPETPSPELIVVRDFRVE